MSHDEEYQQVVSGIHNLVSEVLSREAVSFMLDNFCTLLMNKDISPVLNRQGIKMINQGERK